VGGSTHLSQTGHKRSRETIRCGKSIVHKFIILQVIPIAYSVSVGSLPDTGFAVLPGCATIFCCADDQPYRIELARTPTLNRRDFDARRRGKVLD
jgi:hypothetical protein